MITFVDRIFLSENIPLYECSNCKAEFELAMKDDKGEDPNFCPRCGKDAKK